MQRSASAVPAAWPRGGATTLPPKEQSIGAKRNSPIRHLRQRIAMGERLSEVVIPATPTPPRARADGAAIDDDAHAHAHAHGHHDGESQPKPMVLHTSADGALDQVLMARNIVAAASATQLSTFALHFDPPSAVALAEWNAPPRCSVRAVAIAPDAAVLALLIADHSSAALTLLCPRSLRRLLRLALPAVPSPSVSAAFFSAPPVRPPDHPALRAHMLPPNLRAAFQSISKQHHHPRRQQHTPSAACAPNSLVLALNVLLIYSFSPEYSRLHSFSTHKLPHTSATLVSLPTLPHHHHAPLLRANSFLHTLHAPLLSLPDLHILMPLALTTHPPALLALVKLPSELLAAAVFHQQSVTLTPLTLRTPARNLVYLPRQQGALLLEKRQHNLCAVAKLAYHSHLGFTVSALPNSPSSAEQRFLFQDDDYDILRHHHCIAYHQNSVVELTLHQDTIRVTLTPCKSTLF